MANFTVAGKNIDLDDEGFLLNHEDWNSDVAREIAKNSSLEKLDDEQMEIIQFLRKYYLKFHAFPILNYVCKHVGQKKECLNKEFVNPMLAWKIAGLPKLDGIHFVAVDGKNYRMEECC
jgi:tRNA 2-thiouridine synthesizing protein E